MKNLYKILVVSALVFSLFSVKVSFAAEPTVMTDPASNITTSSATLSAFYNANGETITGAMFKYGTDPLMSQTAYVSTPTSASGTMSTTISGLLPNTTYYFKTVLVSTYGMSQGYSAPFTTLAPVSVKTCSIDSFNANSTSVNSGATVVLSWNTTNCNNLTITPNGVSSILASGSTSVIVNNTTTYTITAYGTNNNDSKSVTVTVNGTPTNSCVINSFTASPSVIDFSRLIDYADVTLSWNTSNCTYVNLGQAGGGSYPASGSTVIAVGAPTTYTLYAYGTNNNDTETVSITSGGSNTGTCTITSFTASRTSVRPGESTTLYWNTRDCSYVGFGNGYGYQTSGSANVTVNTTSRFTIYAYGTNGNDTDTLTIRVENNGGCGAYTCDNDEPACTSDCNNNYPWYSPCNWVGCAVTAQVQAPAVTAPQVVYYQTPTTNQVASNQNSNSNTSTTRSTTNTSKGVYDATENSKLITGTPVDQNNLNGNMLSASAGASGWSFLPSTLLGWLFFIIFILLIVFISRKYSKSSEKDSHGHGH
ncbi:MAG: hypothetical protein KBD48_00795 [Candidatus Pacebacteria bacterium]|nr:hypothetical protein [Candidatus Paceibacterota bacterium]